MVIKYTSLLKIIKIIYTTIYKAHIILFDHPAPSVEVSEEPKETIKSDKNITNIVLPLG